MHAELREAASALPLREVVEMGKLTGKPAKDRELDGCAVSQNGQPPHGAVAVEVGHRLIPQEGPPKLLTQGDVEANDERPTSRKRQFVSLETIEELLEDEEYHLWRCLLTRTVYLLHHAP